MDKLSYDEAVNRADTLSLGGYTDWRLPTIKELYSLIDFSGIDPSCYEGKDISGLVPFIDTEYFDLAWGDIDAGIRMIDAQYASATLHTGSTEYDGDRAGRWTLSDRYARILIPVGVACDTDVPLVMRALMECSRENGRVNEHPAPQVFFTGFG